MIASTASSPNFSAHFSGPLASSFAVHEVSGIGALAGGDGGGQPVKRVGHVSLIGMPAAAMWALASPIVKVPK
jgi:hypothetical protein